MHDNTIQKKCTYQFPAIRYASLSGEWGRLKTLCQLPKMSVVECGLFQGTSQTQSAVEIIR